jgi:hypothetical protein
MRLNSMECSSCPTYTRVFRRIKAACFAAVSLTVNSHVVVALQTSRFSEGFPIRQRSGQNLLLGASRHQREHYISVRDGQNGTGYGNRRIMRLGLPIMGNRLDSGVNPEGCLMKSGQSTLAGRADSSLGAIRRAPSARIRAVGLYRSLIWRG